MYRSPGLTLVPTLVVVILALWTHRTLSRLENRGL